LFDVSAGNTVLGTLGLGKVKATFTPQYWKYEEQETFLLLQQIP
jgi:hypothetical protein